MMLEDILESPKLPTPNSQGLFTTTQLIDFANAVKLHQRAVDASICIDISDEEIASMEQASTFDESQQHLNASMTALCCARQIKTRRQ